MYCLIVQNESGVSQGTSLDPTLLYIHKDVYCREIESTTLNSSRKLNVYENVFTQVILVATTQIGIPY